MEEWGLGIKTCLLSRQNEEEWDWSLMPIRCSHGGKQKVLANLTWQSLFSQWNRDSDILT